MGFHCNTFRRFQFSKRGFDGRIEASSDDETKFKGKKTSSQAILLVCLALSVFKREAQDCNFSHNYFYR